MDAFLVRQEGLLADAAALHYEFLSVTRTAGGWDVRAKYPGLGIAGRHDFVNVPVAIGTTRRFGTAIVEGFRVESSVVFLDRIRVTLRAGNLGGRCFVRRLLDVGVTIDASKRHAMNGIGKRVLLDLQAYLLAVNVLG